MYNVARQDMDTMGIGGEGRRSKLGTAALCCCKVIIGLCLLPLGIAKIVIGAIYFHNCNIEPMIPIFLIVGGIAPLLFAGMTQGGQTEGGGQPSKTCANFGAICGIIGFIFSVGWTICGSIWVFPVYSTVTSRRFTPCDDTYPVPGCSSETCDNTLITFAFVAVIIDWICNAFWAILIMCMICACCKKR